MMSHARAALILRRLARVAPDGRRELHRVARMPCKRGYADEVARWAWMDVKAAGVALRDAVRYAEVVRLGDAVEWLQGAAMLAAAAAVCAMAEDA